MADIPFPKLQYDAALAQERALREAIFLDVPYDISGIKIQNITPFLLARLLAMGTPYLDGGEYRDTDTVRFLWALSPEFCADEAKRDAFIDLAIKTIDDIAKTEAEIEIFLKETFMDGPQGGPASVPYVSGIAWMIYAMARKPFKWKREKTLHTPLREIYQLMRCRKLDKGGIIFNESDKIKATWLDEVNARIKQPEGQN